MSGTYGVSGGRSSPWEESFEKQLPEEAKKQAVNIANAPWLAAPPEAAVSSSARQGTYPAAMFSNPAMFGQPVALAEPSSASTAAHPKPAALPVAPDARRGVSLANLADDVLRGTRTDPTRAFTCGAGYKLYPEVARQPDGKDALVYWKAFNTETKRTEFLVGPDSLHAFTSAPSDYRTAAANAFLGEQDAVTRASAKTVDVAVREGFGPATRELWKAQLTAWTDPAWVAKTTVNVVSAVGPASAAKAELRLQARAAAAEAVVSEPSATGFIAHVNDDLPLGKLAGTRTMNCANCAIATDASIAGSPASALPGDVTRVADLTAVYDKPWSGAMTDPAQMAAAMAEAGPGSRAIVFGQSNSQQVGHFFNVVNDGGTIRFLDGQTGTTAAMTPYNTFWLLRTN